MLEREVKVVNRLGLHARAAARLMKTASKFDSIIEVVKLEDMTVADAKSILSVLTLAASQSAVLNLKISGKDEKQAMETTAALFANGFGED